MKDDPMPFEFKLLIALGLFIFGWVIGYFANIIIINPVI